MWSAECGVRTCAECGVRSAECGVRSVECGTSNPKFVNFILTSFVNCCLIIIIVTFTYP